MRVDLAIRLLLPTVPFKAVSKKSASALLKNETILVWPQENLDQLGLILYSNPLFTNAKLFDISAYIRNESGSHTVVYYIFNLPLFSTWLVLFIKYCSHQPKAGAGGLVSLELLFKSAAWAEREAGELFGIFFFFKRNNRKLVTDYFFKVYPMLKWVPSIGFSEVYLSAEGFFANRPVKVFNSALA